MRRGWEVELIDGFVMTEEDYTWKEVPRSKIVRLTLHYDGRRWDLTGKQAYFVKNRASMVPGIESSFNIERRSVGYYEGATKVHYIIEEHTGNFKMEVTNG